MKKMVKFDKREVLFPSFAGVTGPLDIPRMMSTWEIKVLLIKGLGVSEQLPNGSFVKLTLDNFDKDNSGVAPVEPPPTEPDPVDPPEEPLPDEEPQA